MLDQVRGLRAILQNDIRHSTSVGSINLQGRQRFTVTRAGDLFPSQYGRATTTMRGSIVQHGLEGSALAGALAATTFLDPRHAGMTHRRASTLLLLGAWAIPAVAALLSYATTAGGFLDLLACWIFLPVFVWVLVVPLARLVAQRLDEAATAADIPKQQGRQRAGQRAALWETLAYCGRDHLAYDPRSGAHFPPEGITGYLFHQIPEGEYVAQTDRSARH
ncbi:hypothetical protein [Nocardia sp.]|uniref:hypothetical protein n=1 Tax=Nocardia sp. TaxID=1821 RepID=UPI00260BEAC0|nr:hypothetical protein [Nocardia sp.]